MNARTLSARNAVFGMRCPTKNFSIEFETKKGEIHFMGVRIPVADIQPSELVAPSQKVFDKIVDLELKDKSITCRRGCGACCRQLIPLSIPEAFFLWDMITSLPRDEKAEIGRKFDAISQAMDHAGLSSGSAHALKTKNIDQVYFKLGMPCPFLENEQCSIYEHRPLVCRDYYVESRADNCKNPYNQELKKIKIERNVGSLIAAYSFRLYNMPKIPVPLSRVPDWTKGHTALRAAKWPGAMMFQTIINGLNRVPCANSNISTIRIRMRNTAF
jgi:Fe-S-cluster containining protein